MPVLPLIPYSSLLRLWALCTIQCLSTSGHLVVVAGLSSLCQSYYVPRASSGLRRRLVSLFTFGAAPHKRASGLRSQPGPKGRAYFVAIGIVFCRVTASEVFGSVTLSTPFSKLAAILERSTLSGRPKLRWKEP